MQDRLSTYPGRIKLTPVVGQENVYDVERVDEPSQLGTELKTETLLSDTTAALLGLDNTATPNTAFAQIANLMGDLDAKITECAVGSYTGTGTYGASNANSLTFSFEPKVVMVEHLLVLIRGDTTTISGNGGGGVSSAIAIAWSGKKVTWYNYDQGSLRGNAGLQCNSSNTVYHYVAIG